MWALYLAGDIICRRYIKYVGLSFAGSDKITRPYQLIYASVGWVILSIWLVILSWVITIWAYSFGHLYVGAILSGAVGYQSKGYIQG